jgi:hypothetical protein
MISKSKTFLSADYTPRPHDVLCAKGKSAFTHPGNRRFRITIELCLHSYEYARSKTEKSIIVSGIIDKLGSACRFIRYDRKTGMYYDIGDEAAREKVGQTLREALIQNDPERRERKKNQRAVTKAKKQKTNGAGTTEMPTIKQPDIPRKRRSLRVLKRESLCGVDKALAAMPPTLEFASSNTWFENESDSEESAAGAILYGEDLDALFARYRK